VSPIGRDTTTKRLSYSRSPTSTGARTPSAAMIWGTVLLCPTTRTTASRSPLIWSASAATSEYIRTVRPPARASGSAVERVRVVSVE
jgi:hypothetical protein